MVYDVDGFPDHSRDHADAYGYQIGFTASWVDPFLGAGGVGLDDSDFIDLEISTVGVSSISSATLSILGRSYDTTASGSFNWQTFVDTGETATDLVSNVAPYSWYSADMTSALAPNDNGALIRIKAGPASDSLVVNHDRALRRRELIDVARRVARVSTRIRRCRLESRSTRRAILGTVGRRFVHARRSRHDDRRHARRRAVRQRDRWSAASRPTTALRGCSRTAPARMRELDGKRVSAHGRPCSKQGQAIVGRHFDADSLTATVRLSDHGATPPACLGTVQRRARATATCWSRR